MRLNVTFRSSLPFDPTAHPPGEDLADYLCVKLTAAGVIITDTDNYEDFAWALDTFVGDRRLFLCLGYVGDSDYQWLLQIEAYTVGFWKFWRRDPALVERAGLAPRVHAVLASDPHFSEVRWHQGDFARGVHSATPSDGT